MSNCIYVIQGKGTSRYKIGFTNDLRGRLKSLQKGSPVDLEVLLVHHTDAHEELERALHKYFDSERIYGEWFVLTEEAISYLQQPTNFIMEDLEVSDEWKKIEDNIPSLHELFPSPQESAARLVEIETVKTPVAKVLPKRKSNVAPEEPTDGMLFCSSRYKAVEQLRAEDARRAANRIDLCGCSDLDVMVRLRAYADALDVYTGGYTYSIPLD